jgi:predicted GIY-YIG superfamily endonuclease
MTIVYIYAFIHHPTNEYWYVGFSNNCVLRFNAHKNGILGTDLKKKHPFHWNVILEKAWNDIEMVVIDLIEVEDEIDWMKDWRIRYLEYSWIKILGAKYNYQVVNPLLPKSNYETYKRYSKKFPEISKIRTLICRYNRAGKEGVKSSRTPTEASIVKYKLYRDCGKWKSKIIDELISKKR